MTPGDFQKVIAALDDQRRGSISFALALVQRIKTREVIPQLVQFFKKGGGDSVWWANRDILLNDLFDHNDLPFLYELLNHQEDLQNFATIARQYGLGEAGEDYLRSLARDGLLKVLGPKDSDDLLLRLEKASGFSLATLLLGLEKIGSRDDIQIAGEYLGREEDIAYAAAKVIATHATHEDIGLLSGMERHVFPGVRMEAMRAHLRLRTALSMPAVVKIFNNAPYDSDDKNVRGEKEELKDLVLSHAIAEDIEALAGLDHKFSEVEELMSELKKRFGRKRGADPTVEHANLWTGDCKAEQFVPLVKEEDLIDDRFNLRRMLFDPSDAVFKAAVEIIIKYQPTGCFNDLLEAYKFGVEYIQNRSGLIRAYHLKDVLFAVASQDDLPQIEQMLEPDFPKKWDRVEEENEKLLALGISLISKLRAWQLIPKITPLANDGNIEAKLCMFGFAEDIKDWSAAVDYLGDREPAVAQKAVEVLINISTPEKLSNFKEMLTSSGTPYQYAAAEVLAAMLQVKDLPQQEEDPVPNGTGLGYNTYSPPTKISQMLDEIKKLLENTADVHRISALLNVVNVLDIQLSDSQVRRLIEICNNWHGPITKKVLALAAKRGASKYLPAVLKMVDAQEWRLVSDYLDQIVEIYRTVGLPKIRKQLRSKSAKRRAVAVAALGEYGEQSDVARVEKILLKNIKDDRVSARAYSRMAARGLDMGDVRGKMLQASGSARYAYAKAFVMQASKDDAVLIRRMLTDQKEYLRAAGIEAATRLGMADLLPTIRARLQDRGGFLSDPPKSVLLPAVAFVKELGGREDLDLVKGAVGRGIERADEAFLAHATEEDLEKAREWTKKDEDFNHNPRFVLLGIRLFVKFNQTEAIPIIKYWLKRGSHIDGFTKTLIEALVQLSPKEDKEYLIKLAEAARVSLKAVIAGLTTWFEESDIEKYRDAILKGDNLSLVYLAVLSKKAPEVALEVSRQRLKELTTPSGYFYPWDSLSKYVKCLGELGDEQDLPMLFIQLSHSNAGTASDAAKAFGKILPRVAKTKT